jgi:phosphoglycerol transferase MdoB-like AlkP superfamily enzyme
MLISAGIVLVVSNLVDLSAIASVGSACSLMIFVLVAVAGYRLRAETGANVPLVLLGGAAALVVLGFFAVDTLRNDPATFVAIVVIAALAVIIDTVWKRSRDEQPPVEPQPAQV